MTRNESEPTYKFAEIKYGKIVSINSHWVPLEEYRKFFAADSFFIDITGVIINGEEPTIGDCITFTENPTYKISILFGGSQDSPDRKT